jgi:hypothetical protein
MYYVKLQLIWKGKGMGFLIATIQFPEKAPT